jgi:hypothetical protein
MAAIDKIYGTQEQYLEFKEWLKDNKPSATRYLYPEKCTNEKDRAISNFPETIDMWLLDNCPIKWVVEYIKDQYDIT